MLMPTVLMYWFMLSGTSVDVAMWPGDRVFSDALFPSPFVSSVSGDELSSEVCSQSFFSTQSLINSLCEFFVMFIPHELVVVDDTADDCLKKDTVRELVSVTRADDVVIAMLADMTVSGSTVAPEIVVKTDSVVMFFSGQIQVCQCRTFFVCR